MEEQIGNVLLNLTHYSGKDIYSDGRVEDELLDIVRERPQSEYQAIIEEKKSWPILYHLSHFRENIVDWIPMDKTAKVLEVGSGCGAVTGALSRKAGQVTCVDLSRKRSLINAYRHQDCENVTIHVGNFRDIEPDLPTDYDFIFLVGVFEYGISYMGTEKPFEEFLSIIQKHAAPRGRIVIAIESKYGLKYFAGCREDHLGTFFSGIESYAAGGGVRTFSRPGLEKIFAACGVEEYHFYYPYPDYKFMTTVYSDERLPKKGELSNNLRNFDRDRLVLFDERHAFDGIIEDGLFPLFSNSYEVILGKDFDVKYVKYSNDRDVKYQIRTEIVKRKGAGEEAAVAGNGVKTAGEKGPASAGAAGTAGGKNPASEGTAGSELVVRKVPLTVQARTHVAGLAKSCEALKNRYQGGRMEINRCKLTEADGAVAAEFEYLEGRLLSELLDECLAREDMDGFMKLFREYVKRTGYHEDASAADYDLAFDNIMVQGDRWTIIDYEWTLSEPVEVKETAFRAIQCYLSEDEGRGKLDLNRILKELYITPKEADRYRIKEKEFQDYVTGNRKAMSDIRAEIGELVMPLSFLEDRYLLTKNVQIYEDKGEGFSEGQSYFVKNAYVDAQEIELKLFVEKKVRALRIDPAMEACVVRVKELTFNGKAVPVQNGKIFSTNGKSLKKDQVVVFATEDPNICIHLETFERQEEDVFYARMEVAKLPGKAAQSLAESVKRIF
ncbi:MAG: class I SAM-dependent methyltransferase [Lachnospiraceae bacterium]|nr:class I SAM-dependent methyltransferase [Lachnospiraceae bacterium]